MPCHARCSNPAWLAQQLVARVTRAAKRAANEEALTLRPLHVLADRARRRRARRARRAAFNDGPARASTLIVAAVAVAVRAVAYEGTRRLPERLHLGPVGLGLAALAGIQHALHEGTRRRAAAPL